MGKKKGKLKGALKKIGKGVLAVSTGGVSLINKKNIKKVKSVVKAKKGVLKKIGQGVLAVSTGGLSLAASKKGKAAIKKVAKKLKSVKPLNVLKKIAQKAGNLATFTTLLPFMGAMLLALKKKGVKVPHKGNAKEVANLFYINIIKKQHLESCESMGNNGDVAYNHASKLFRNSKESRQHLIEEAASGIITAILNFFTGRKKQQEAAAQEANGEDVSPENQLTDEEKDVVEDAGPVTADDAEVIDAVDDAHDELAAEVGGEDSDGNIHVPEDAVEEEVSDEVTEDLDGEIRHERNPFMKHFNRY